MVEEQTMMRVRCFAVALVVVFSAAEIKSSENSSRDEGEFISAWSSLVAEGMVDPSIPALEQEALRLMTPAQAAGFLEGIDATTIILRDGRTLAELLDGAGSFELSLYTIDGGGLFSTGGPFALTSSIGQPDAGTMTGGAYGLTGGFIQAQTDESLIFRDGFESGDTSAWSSNG